MTRKEIDEKAITEVFLGVKDVLRREESAIESEKVYGVIEALVDSVDVNKEHTCEFLRDVLLECINNKIDRDYNTRKIVANHVLGCFRAWN